jgi:hypothetical protein
VTTNPKIIGKALQQRRRIAGRHRIEDVLDDCLVVGCGHVTSPEPIVSRMSEATSGMF